MTDIYIDIKKNIYDMQVQTLVKFIDDLVKSGNFTIYNLEYGERINPDTLQYEFYVKGNK